MRLRYPRKSFGQAEDKNPVEDTQLFVITSDREGKNVIIGSFPQMVQYLDDSEGEVQVLKMAYVQEQKSGLSSVPMVIYSRN